MNSIRILTLAFLYFVPTILFAQSVQDDFEGNGNILSWHGDDCVINTTLANPFSQGINPSATVLEYADVGGTWCNVRFDVNQSFDFSNGHTFSLKIYVPSSSVTGSSVHQVSLKLQNSDVAEPWTTQTEIIKPIVLDQWQLLHFNFLTDPFINFDMSSGDPIDREDFNRVLIQVNGEGNNDSVVAYIDDVYYDGLLASNNQGLGLYDQLVWSDECDGNGAIDTSKWFHQTQLPNGASWYNNELQHYTDRVENAFYENGFMTIKAIKEQYTDQGQTKSYTSARLNSKFAFIYGRVEVRAKLPIGVGTWPAIWMLGKNIIEPGGYWTSEYGTVHWPFCGEIDIMEHWGTNQNYVSSAIHTPSSNGGTINHGGTVASDVANSFHVFTLDWYPEKMEFRLDDALYYTYIPEPKNLDTWPFDLDQYILLNVAMVGNVDPNFVESPMVIDYVRVYQKSAVAVPELDSGPLFEVYPNPVFEELFVNVEEGFIGAQIMLTSLTGQVLGYYWVESKQQRIDVSTLSPGLYVLSLTTNETKQVIKFLKE